MELEGEFCPSNWTDEKQTHQKKKGEKKISFSNQSEKKQLKYQHANSSLSLKTIEHGQNKHRMNQINPRQRFYIQQSLLPLCF